MAHFQYSYPGMHSLLNFEVEIEHVENIAHSPKLDSKHFTEYVVRVSTNLSVWEVYRRFSDFASLRDILSRQFPQLDFPDLPSKTNTRRHSHSAGSLASGPSVVERKRKSLENFLRVLMTIEEIWVSSAFIEFLDDSPAPSLGMQIQFTAVSNQVQYLRFGYLALERKLEKAEETISAAVSVIRELQMTHRSDNTVPSRRSSIQSIAEEVECGAQLLPEYKKEKSVTARPLSWRSLMRVANIGGVYHEGTEHNASPKTEVEQWDETEDVERLSAGTHPDIHANPSPLGDLRFYQRRPSNSSLSGLGFGTTPSGLQRPVSTELVHDDRFTDSMSDDSDEEAGPGSFLGFSANAPHSKRPSYASIAEEVPSVREVVEQSKDDSKPFRRNSSLLALWSSVDEEPSVGGDASRPEPEPRPDEAEVIVEPAPYFSDGRVPSAEALDATGQGRAFDQVLDMVHVANHACNRLLARSNAQVFLARHMKKSVMAKALAVGCSTVLHCLLPDDPLDVTLILWKGSESSWHTTVGEYFSRLASIAAARADQIGGDMHVGMLEQVEEDPGEWEELYEDLCSTSLTLGRYASRVVEVAPGRDAGAGADSGEGRQEIIMSFDGLRVNLVPNARQALCMTAFFEEFSGLVGGDFLFKKSLVLLRAWWLYEAPLYGLGNVAGALSEDALTIMLCVVFNLYHKSITEPVQALGAFFAEYENFDWFADAVTLQGPVKLANLINGSATLRPNSAHAAGEKVISPYVGVYDPSRFSYSATRNCQGVVVAAADSSPTDTDSAPGSGVASPEQRHSLTGANGPVGGIANEISSGEDADKMGSLPSVPAVSAVPKEAFNVGAMNIVHPFHHSINMTPPGRIDSALANSIRGCFAMGASRFMASMAKIAACENNSTGYAGFVALSGEFFPGLTGRHGGEYLKIVSSSFFVPENLNFLLNPSSAAASTSTLATLDGLGKIVRTTVAPSYTTKQAWFEAAPTAKDAWNKIHYANLLLHGYVSDHALWSLCVDVLQDRGFIPVGEIGKFLQELTGSVSMSGILKDKYGGLKKFLELHGADFLISGNHPFNPNVYLKTALTAVEQQCIERGETPTSFMTRYKKKSQKKKKSGAGGVVDSPNARDAHGNPIGSHSKIHKSSLSAPTSVSPAPSNSSSKGTAKAGANASKQAKQNVRNHGADGLSSADQSFSQWAQQQPGQSRESLLYQQQMQQQYSRQQYEYQGKLSQEKQRRFMYGGQQHQHPIQYGALRSPPIYSQTLSMASHQSEWQGGDSVSMGHESVMGGGMGESQESVNRRRSSYPMKQLATELLDPRGGDGLSPAQLSQPQDRYGGAQQPISPFQSKVPSSNDMQSMSVGLGGGFSGSLLGGLGQPGSGVDGASSYQQAIPGAPSLGRYHGLLHSNQLGGELLGRDSYRQGNVQWGGGVGGSTQSFLGGNKGIYNSESELSGQMLQKQGRNFFD